MDLESLTHCPRGLSLGCRKWYRNFPQLHSIFARHRESEVKQARGTHACATKHKHSLVYGLRDTQPGQELLQLLASVHRCWESFDEGDLPNTKY